MEEYEAYINGLPDKIIEAFIKINGEPPSEEEFQEINKAYKELKSNVQQLKTEINEKFELMQNLGERFATEPDIDPAALVTELIESCRGAGNDDSLFNDLNVSTESIDSIKTNETNKSKVTEISSENNESYAMIDAKEAKETKDTEDINEILNTLVIQNE